MVENIKWLFALAVIIAALVAFYAFPEESTLFRLIGLLAALGVAGAVALRTEKGLAAWSFAKESRMEVRKVVWPTRKETVQTTGLILGMVGVVAVTLWILDSTLGWLMKQLLGQGG